MQAKLNLTAAAVALAVLLSGCGQDEQNKTQQPAAKQAVFGAQQQALEKAKQVEGVIDEADQRQRKMIDEQSQ